MSDFIEIKPVSLKEMGYEQTENNCPKCGEKLFRGAIACPERRIGCLVLHQGYVCNMCKSTFLVKNNE